MSDRIQQSRDYLIDFMRENFTDKTFDFYISDVLAGDFACEMATIIERLTALNNKLLAEGADAEEI